MPTDISEGPQTSPSDTDMLTIKEQNVVAVVEDAGSYTVIGLLDTEPPALPKLQTVNTTVLPSCPTLQNPSHLRGTVYILVSTKSGVGHAASFASDILQPVLRSVGITGAKVLHTESEQSVKQFVTNTLLPKANLGKEQTVILLSGDGGIVDAINAIEQAGSRNLEYAAPTVALLPLGTGNALFHSLHKSSTTPSIYVQGLRTLLNGTPANLPIFQAKFSAGARLLTNEGQTATPLHNDALLGAVVASYGLHATLVADSDTVEWRKHGDKRFGLVAQNLLWPPGGGQPHPYRADIILKQEVGIFKQEAEYKIPRDTHGYVLLTLVSNLEKTFTISPESKPLDGKLRVIHFGPLDGKEVMSIMTGAYEGGKHVEREEVGYSPVQGMRIDFKELGGDSTWRRCCIDGSIVAVEEGGWLEVSMVEGEMLRVLVS